jgi:hypothetical protein
VDFFFHNISDLFCVVSFYPVFIATRYGPGKDSFPAAVDELMELIYPVSFLVTELVVGTMVLYILVNQGEKIKAPMVNVIKIGVLAIREKWLLLTSLNISTIVTIFVFNSLQL